MADPRTFTLIGEFQDGITPELQKINNQLAALKRSFSNIGGKGARTASRDFGRFAVASKELVNALKEQNQALRSAVEPMRQYRTEVGKTVAAMKKLQTTRGGARGIEETNRALEQQIRLLERLQRVESRGPGYGGGGRRRPPRPPVGAGGGMPTGRPMPRAGRGGGGGGYGGGGSGFNTNDYNMGTFAFAFSLGQGVSQPITSAIVAGFQMGVGLMTKPFEYFAQNLQERMQDEMSDLKAAGGFFSLSREQKGEKLVNSFDQAVDFTQANNKLLDKIAASLPGSTQDYIEVSKRISDSIARTVVRDTAGSVKLAEQIRKEDQKTYGYEAITGTGTGAQRKAVQVLLADLTKQTVLAGQGGRAGAGGQMGAYGLPQLTERMLGQSEVSMGQFQKYSAIFSDPMVMDALAKEIPNINKTAANSADRIIAIRKMYERVLPPELIERYRRTLAGVTETFNTAIFGKESGIFGLGRKMQGMGKKINEFGQYIDWYGNVTTDVTKAMNADLSLYDLFRDVVVNIGQVIAPIVENLSQIWDPLRQLGLDLGQARDFTAKLLQSFNYYKKGFTEFIKDFSPEELKQFGKTGGVELRATLATIGNLFRQFGVISKTDFGDLIEQLKDPKAKVGPILQGMIEKFFDSSIAEKIGEFIGTLVGTVLSEVAKVTGFLADKVGGNKLASGFTKGFEAAGGPAAFSAIFEDVFKLMFEGLKFVLKALPWQAYALMAAALVIPAAISGIAMFAAQGIANALMGGFAKGMGGKGLTDMIAKVFQTIFAKKNVAVGDLSNVITDPRRLLAPAKASAGALPSAALGPKAAQAPGLFAKIGTALKNFWKAITLPMKAFGKLNVATAALTGVIEFVTALFTGKDLAESLGATAGPVIGSMIGGALLGPLGAAIGGWLGSMKPVVDTFTGIFKGIGWALQNAWATVGPTLEALGGIVQVLWSTFAGMIPGLDNATAGLDLLNIAFIATKVALFPFISILNGVAFALQALRLGLLKFDLWLNKTFQWGDREGRIQAEIDKAQKAMEETALRQQRINEDLLKPLEDKKKPPRPPKPPKPVSVDTLNDITRMLGGDPNAPLNTPKLTGAGGQKPPAKPLKPVSVDQLNDMTRMLGGNPNAPLKTPQLKAFGGKVEQNIFQLNDRAARQVTAVTAAGRATEATKKATEQTKTAVVAQKASLSTIQTTLTAMYSFLASGMLRVQTQMQPGMFPPGFGIPGVPNAGVKDPNTGIPLWMSQAVTTRYDGGWGDAVATEMKHKPPGSDLVIANSSETIIPASGLQVRSAWGGMNTTPTVINTSITINQQPGQDADELATIVAMKIGEAVSDARAASLFV
jgi:hypothetical protein